MAVTSILLLIRAERTSDVFWDQVIHTVAPLLAKAAWVLAGNRDIWSGTALQSATVRNPRERESP